MEGLKCLFLFTCFILTKSQDQYVLDTSPGLGRRFDGLGAISGGGATSKLLQNYPEQQKGEILDFLFKPNFGASLQIFKVEIGGDVQSTEGTECSHMHESWDEDYTRGYEWMMMVEAKKRNPNIKLYGLPWGFPGWLGNDGLWPYGNPSRLATYIVNWVQGAKIHYNLTIDYLGIWNEKPYDVTYVKTLRKTLNTRGFSNVQLVVGDLETPSAWEVIDEIAKDPEFNKTVDFVGIHYPGTYTPDKAQVSGKPLWSSEDYSATADDSGAACLGRIINQNYLTGYMTSTIVWNILAAYYDNLPISRHSLMVSTEPWSGHYEVTGPLWAAAHTTQFTQIGWTYLKHGYGVEMLWKHGSLVTLASPDQKDFTIVIETMDPSTTDACLRTQDSYTTQPQNVTLVLKGATAAIKEVNVWYTKLGSGGNPSIYFDHKGSIKIAGGKINLQLGINEIYTLTTLTSGFKGTHGNPPVSKPFPLPYTDAFDIYPIGSEAYNFAQQIGAFEVRYYSDRNYRYSKKSPEKVLTQVVQTPPIHWCPESQTQPITVMGDFNWSNISVSVDVIFPAENATKGIFVGVHINQGGCYTFEAKGVYVFLLMYSQSLVVSNDLSRTEVVYTIPIKLKPQEWYGVKVMTQGSHLKININDKTIFDNAFKMATPNGFVGFGTDNFGLAHFDNFVVKGV